MGRPILLLAGLAALCAGCDTADDALDPICNPLAATPTVRGTFMESSGEFATLDSVNLARVDPDYDPDHPALRVACEIHGEGRYTCRAWPGATSRLLVIFEGAEYEWSVESELDSIGCHAVTLVVDSILPPADHGLPKPKNPSDSEE